MINQSEIEDVNRRLKAYVGELRKPDRKKALRKGASIIAREAKKTQSFKDRTGLLRESLGIIPGLNKSLDVFVGNRRKGKFKDAFYAQMIFGSAKRFRQRVLESAVSRSGTRAIQAVKRDVEKILIKSRRKFEAGRRLQ